MGHWSLILGHAPKKITNQLKKQLNYDWMHGTLNKNSIELSEKISKVVPVAEKIRYASTGTEATMYAVRLARTITQRKTIAKIDGGWHGYTTDLLKTVNWPFQKSESSGLTDEKHVISLPYNDLENSIKILKSKKMIWLQLLLNQFLVVVDAFLLQKNTCWVYRNFAIKITQYSF
jgi:glutamate-1-semialdehyde 2,1-aminomutase